MSHHSLINRRFTLLAVLIAGAITFAQWKGWLPKEEGGRVPGTGRPETAGRPGPDERSSPSGGRMSRKAGTWEELRGCQLMEDRSNDGDSFVVLHEGQRSIIRLYFADCPEKYRHQFNKDRLAEQGRYFGGLTEEETVTMGEEARDFSLGLLRAGSFTVLTRWEKVFDSERHYAFVAVEQGDLAHLLVKQGLARIHTKGESRFGGVTAAVEKSRLQLAERDARKERRGAWSQR